MKIKPLFATVALTLSGLSFAAPTSLGVLDAAGSSFSSLFGRAFGFGSPGAFTDHYTFDLLGSSTASGSASVSLEWGLDLNLTEVALSGGTLANKVTSVPLGFSFSNLGAGTYFLDVSGTLSGRNGLAAYSGSIQSIASAAPEPEALGMALAGLLAVGLLARRRAQG